MVLWRGGECNIHSTLGTQETQGILPATEHGLTDHDGGVGFSWSSVSSSPDHLRFQVPFPKGDRAGKNTRTDSRGYWFPRELPAVQGRMMEQKSLEPVPDLGDGLRFPGPPQGKGLGEADLSA